MYRLLFLVSVWTVTKVSPSCVDLGNGTHHCARFRMVRSEYDGVTGERPEGEMRVRGKRRRQVAVDHAVFVTS